MPQFDAIKYRIPVLDGRAVFICLRCGQIVTVEVQDTDVYESPSGLCPPCKKRKKRKTR